MADIEPLGRDSRRIKGENATAVLTRDEDGVVTLRLYDGAPDHYQVTITRSDALGYTLLLKPNGDYPETELEYTSPPFVSASTHSHTCGGGAEVNVTPAVALEIGKYKLQQLTKDPKFADVVAKLREINWPVLASGYGEQAGPPLRFNEVVDGPQARFEACPMEQPGIVARAAQLPLAPSINPFAAPKSKFSDTWMTRR